MVNYPNLYLQYEVVNELSPEERNNAPLVRDRENLLTFDRVGEILGAKPRSYYNMVDGAEHRELKWLIVVVERWHPPRHSGSGIYTRHEFDCTMIGSSGIVQT